MSFSRYPERSVGSLLILAQGVVWGLFPVMPVLLGRTLGPGATLTFSAAFAAAFLLPLAFLRGRLRGLWSWPVQRSIFIGSLLIGGIYYGLTLYGLQYTMPGNAALILLTEIVFNTIFARWHHGERIGTFKAAGIILILCGAVIVLSRGVGAWNPGDWILVLACLFPPYGNWCMQQACKRADSAAVLGIRSAWTILFGLVLAFPLGESISWNPVRASLGFLAINGIVVLAMSKLLWLEGIKRLFVTDALALSKTSVFWVMIFAWILLGQKPATYQLLAAIPMLIGAWIVAKVSSQPVVIPSRARGSSGHQGIPLTPTPRYDSSFHSE